MNDRIDEGFEEFWILFIPKCTPSPPKKTPSIEQILDQKV